ncbi:MAG TPA: NAD(+) diphosphatase [Bacteroidales bacterium]|nr:NAD(+) diphosphatase [Bacteroidales bacterium]
MIQEIHPHRFNNHYQPGKQPEDHDFVLYYQDKTVLLKDKGLEAELPRTRDFAEIPPEQEFIFLFTLDETPCFLTWNLPDGIGTGLVFRDIHFFRNTWQKEIAWACLAGLHLRDWYFANRYCGQCGTATCHKPDERALVCPACGAIAYPKISPAIIVAILCGDHILLARGNDFPGAWYSLIAGYADIGESLEEALVREVREETGLDVWNIRYYGSQPWPLSGSMMIGFTAEADDRQTLQIDHKELADAAWFQKDALPHHPPALSIAGEMIEKFERGKL